MKPEIKQRIQQINNGIVPDGYKKTEFGVFPCDWVTEKTVDNVCKINPKTAVLPDKFIYLDLESVLDRKIVEKQIVEKINAPSRAQRVLSPNDIIFQVVRPYQKNNFFFQTEDEEYKTVASTGYALLRSEMQPFLFQLIHSDYFVNQVNVKCTGTNYPAINGDDLSKVKVAYPADTKEQEKIAEILMKWDEAIELQEKYIEKLLKKRDAIVQRLIKKKDGWHEEKLSNILTERTEYATKEDGYPHVTLSMYGVAPKTDRYNRDFLVKQDDKKYKITKQNDICYNPANLKFGVICINKYENDAIFSPIYITYEVSNEHNTDFIGAILCSKDFIRYIRKYEEGTVYERQAVKSSDFLRGVIWIPDSKEEQDKIASVIKKNNDLIEQQTSLYESYKQQRKALQQYLLNGIVRVNDER